MSMNASLKSPVKIMPSVITSLAVTAVAAPVGTLDATAILVSYAFVFFLQTEYIFHHSQTRGKLDFLFTIHLNYFVAVA